MVDKPDKKGSESIKSSDDDLIDSDPFLKRMLIRRAEDMRGNLRLVVIGAGIFFAGMGLILWADRSLPSSVGQELISLLGLALVAGGGVTALIGYLSLSVLRLFKFMHDDPDE